VITLKITVLYRSCLLVTIKLILNDRYLPITGKWQRACGIKYAPFMQIQRTAAAAAVRQVGLASDFLYLKSDRRRGEDALEKDLS
jgi:hypothetical protein